jgi:hypothetical protein
LPQQNRVVVHKHKEGQEEELTKQEKQQVVLVVVPLLEDPQ